MATHATRRAPAVPLGSIPVLMLALLLVLSACGGQETTEASSSEEQHYESPLNEYMGFNEGVDFSDSEAAEAHFAEQQQRVNEQVVACMAEQGFEYIPEDHGDTVIFGEEADEEGLVWGSEEWTAKYGFGISTQLPQDVVGPELLGMDDSMFMEDEGEHHDPNEEYINSLSEADQEAYFEALYGNDPGPDIAEDMTEEEMDAAYREWEENREITSCQDLAWESVNDGDGQQAFYREFGDEMEDMWESIQSDPRVVAAENEVSECMADKGFTYTSMNDTYEEFDELMQPFWDMAFNNDPMANMSEEAMTEMSDEELDELFRPQELPDEAKAELAEIQTREVAMAMAVNECGGGWEANADVFEEVRVELEQEFIDANKDRLDAFRAEQEGSSAEQG